MVLTKPWCVLDRSMRSSITAKLARAAGPLQHIEALCARYAYK
jgi:hypothetical protein